MKTRDCLGFAENNYPRKTKLLLTHKSPPPEMKNFILILFVPSRLHSPPPDGFAAPTQSAGMSVFLSGAVWRRFHLVLSPENFKTAFLNTKSSKTKAWV